VDVSVGWFLLYYLSIMGVCKMKNLTGRGKYGADFVLVIDVGPRPPW
jgi:hypothetical protein